MPSKKLTKKKREQLKKKENRIENLNFLVTIFGIIFVIIIIAVAVIFFFPKPEEENQDLGTKYFSPVAKVDFAYANLNSVNFSIDVLANDSDSDGEELNILSVGNPKYGKAIIESNYIVYNPDYNFSGWDVFSYKIEDEDNLTSTSNVFVSVGDSNPLAAINTSKGIIYVELYEEKTPITVANFISYANNGFYDGLVFHRVIDGFMIQGGGFYPDGTKKDTEEPIDLEINQDVRHVDGAIAMARTNDPDSATSQFYICDGAQHGLDDSYAAFGVTIGGMDIVSSISSVSTTTKFGMQDWPETNVLINSIKILNE